MLPLMSFSQIAAWCSSGARIISTSAHCAASLFASTLNPAPSAFFAEAEPGRSAIATSFTPLSRRFCACAWPWLP
jgi:hypothetical protein